MSGANQDEKMQSTFPLLKGMCGLTWTVLYGFPAFFLGSLERLRVFLKPSGDVFFHVLLY